MARTTVDDCIEHCTNHFELVLGAVKRSKNLRKGEISELPFENDRFIVHALREIASGDFTVDLEQEIINSMEEDERLTSGEINISPETESEQPVAQPAND